ncbi:hypothetical protein PAECIP111892_02129 [Paenibacillus auburnensis]|uniref:Uncharacterized protein n=1 Tax=Paenibacillus auburnensis TaxID=2905649 RepID=A0ABM9BWD9_9BACL|nr:hypothetical protein PAECIP111892_02129 [Paenibacillus auburnensis]
MRMYTDPRGGAYEQVIDLAISNSECFVLGRRFQPIWRYGTGTQVFWRRWSLIC